jgi:hypothetical protein
MENALPLAATLLPFAGKARKVGASGSADRGNYADARREREGGSERSINRGGIARDGWPIRRERCETEIPRRSIPLESDDAIIDKRTCWKESRSTAINTRNEGKFESEARAHVERARKNRGGSYSDE